MNSITLQAHKLSMKILEIKKNERFCNITLNISNLREGLIISSNGMFFEDADKVAVIIVSQLKFNSF